jgi:hypothetical protein
MQEDVLLKLPKQRQNRSKKALTKALKSKGVSLILFKKSLLRTYRLDGLT